MYWLPPCSQIGSDLPSMGIPVTADQQLCYPVDNKHLQSGFIFLDFMISGYKEIFLVSGFLSGYQDSGYFSGSPILVKD